MGNKKDLHKHTCSVGREDVLWFLSKYRFPPGLGYTVPRPSDTIRSEPSGKIGLYFAMFEMGNVRLPFTLFFLSVLHYFRFHVSELTPFGAARIAMFDARCRANNGEPTVVLFRRFFKLACAGDWYIVEKRTEVGVGEGMVGVKDSLKGWKSRFFYVNASVVDPAYLNALIFRGSVTKGAMSDPFPLEGFDADLYKKLKNLPVQWRVLPEPVLYLAKLSKTWAYYPAEPVIEGVDGEGMESRICHFF